MKLLYIALQTRLEGEVRPQQTPSFVCPVIPSNQRARINISHIQSKPQSTETKPPSRRAQQANHPKKKTHPLCLSNKTGAREKTTQPPIIKAHHRHPSSPQQPHTVPHTSDARTPTSSKPPARRSCPPRTGSRSSACTRSKAERAAKWRLAARPIGGRGGLGRGRRRPGGLRGLLGGGRLGLGFLRGVRGLEGRFGGWWRRG